MPRKGRGDWLCPKCGKVVGPRKWPRVYAERNLELHLKAVHQGIRGLPESIQIPSLTHPTREFPIVYRSPAPRPGLPKTKNPATENPREPMECPRCNIKIVRRNLTRHLAQCTGPRLSNADDTPFTSGETVPVRTLSFTLLPPGSWSIDDVISHYKYSARVPGTHSWGGEIDPMRIEWIKDLDPKTCWVGKELWNGYAVFEFDWTDRVVLECPLKGNATYVLSGDWQSMVGHNKRYLLTHYRRDCTRIVHSSRTRKWLREVRDAL